MHLAWLTDIHLNFLEGAERLNFYKKIIKTHCDAVLITGDIAEAPSLVAILSEMADQISKPIYFVLGNHDYYRGQIDEVRKTLTRLTKIHTQLFWLPASSMQQLDKETILLGQDSWADGQLGDYKNSTVSLYDSVLIADLFQAKILGDLQLLNKMQYLANIDAKQLENDLAYAIKQNPKKIIVLMHVPPFKEACVYQGKISDDNWLPYFSSKITGDILTKIAQENLAIDFLVLCGHTHGEAHYQHLPNLTIKVGKAKYYKPNIQEIINLTGTSI
ncbi:MAG: metallophosphoesterase [Gammaproteobacteria bacterium]